MLKSFMDAQLGCEGSYPWRSILGARHIIEKGMKWVIGDGNKFKIWRDPWQQDRGQKTPAGIIKINVNAGWSRSNSVAHLMASSASTLGDRYHVVFVNGIVQCGFVLEGLKREITRQM
ncbi:hypothetical protein VNO77_17018 [Canavalia gladiata]|uniref:Uncharacterized protein n=1 Tax=Canavalia gladiata TaxID=3824 RepID=A0AAN9LIY2_CANGL